MGKKTSGGDSSGVSNYLTSGVVKILTNYKAFAVIKDNNTVMSWGLQTTVVVEY